MCQNAKFISGIASSSISLDEKITGDEDTDVIAVIKKFWSEVFLITNRACVQYQ